MKKSSVQAAELWLPQGEVMAFGAGAYRGNQELMGASMPLRFHYGEGLPGAVWASGQALLWKELAGPFARAEVAAAAGIDAAIGLPLFEGDRLIAVLTLLLSSRVEVPSCVEVWDVADELDVLKHARGYYVQCAELERFSPFIQFPRGTGLPGLTWLSGEIEVMEDVRRSNAFIRAGLAAKCGLKNGIGLPIYRNRRVLQVVTLFGAEQRSLITGIELYHPQGAEVGPAMLFDFGGTGAAGGQSVADASGRKLAQEVLSTRLPSLIQLPTPSGLEITLAMPLHDKKGLKEIAVLRF
jgi:hypothetical protein